MTSKRALVRFGVRSLLMHRLRSLLSILGVVFGVAAVVSMSSVGEGARREAVAQIGSLGIDTITVRSGGASGALRAGDAQSLAAVVPHVVAVAPVREAPLTASLGAREAAVTVVGTTPGYSMASRLPLARGRFLTDLDLRDRKRVAVLGAGVARQLVAIGDPVGELVRVGPEWFRVVGVLESRATPRARATPIRLRDVNRSIYVPLRALDYGSAKSDPDGIDEIVVRLDQDSLVVQSAVVVRSALARTTGRKDFELIVPREILRQKERTQRIFNIVTGVIATIGLLVGGIGIMNIMLASVAERTQEIGIRRALGASQRDIAAQFLTEALLLTSAGGLAGLFLGMAGAWTIQRLADWPTALSASMLVLSLAMALIVGLGFGLYPAWNAARLQPMEALRRG